MTLKVSITMPQGLKMSAQILAEEFKHAMDLSTSELEQAAKELAPHPTGNLRRAITSDVVSLGGVVTGIVYPNMQQAPYAANVEFGTGIYSEYPGAPKRPITPKTKKVLAFMLNRGDSRPTTSEGWRQAIADGRAIITKSVKGSRPQPYMRPAFEAGKVKIDQNFRDAVARARRRLGG